MKSLLKYFGIIILSLLGFYTPVKGCSKVLTDEFFKYGPSTYVIEKKYDLKGTTISVPFGSTLVFKGGSLSNGTLAGNDTKLIGLDKKSFRNLEFEGNFIVSKVTYSMFSSYDSDTKLLSAMFNLALSGRDSCTLIMEKNRVYDFYSEYDIKKAGYTGYFEFKNCENKTVVGNGAIINDKRRYSFLTSSACQFIMTFYGAKNIIIKNLNYQNKSEIILWDTKTTDPGYKGYGFICIRDKSRDISVSVSSMTGCRYGVYAGDAVSSDDLTPTRNIIVNVDKAFNVGYPVLMENVDVFSINVNSESVHRTCYIVGSSNGHIFAKVKNQHTAPFQILLSEKIWVYKGESYSKGISNVTIDVEDLGSEDAKDGSALCGLGMWFDENVSFGNTIGEWRNIVINAAMNKNSPVELGAFGANINVKDSSAALAKRKYVLDHIKITVNDARENTGVLSRLVWFTVNSNTVVNNVDLKLSSDVSWVILSGVNGKNVNIQNSNVELLSVLGNINVEKTNVKRLNYYKGIASDDFVKKGYVLNFKDSSVSPSDIMTMRSNNATVIIK